MWFVTLWFLFDKNFVLDYIWFCFKISFVFLVSILLFYDFQKQHSFCDKSHILLCNITKYIATLLSAGDVIFFPNLGEL